MQETLSDGAPSPQSHTIVDHAGKGSLYAIKAGMDGSPITPKPRCHLNPGDDMVLHEVHLRKNGKVRPSLTAQARTVRDKFTKAFASCHQLYNGYYLTDAGIEKLGTLYLQLIHLSDFFREETEPFVDLCIQVGDLCFLKWRDVGNLDYWVDGIPYPAAVAAGS